MSPGKDLASTYQGGRKLKQAVWACYMLAKAYAAHLVQVFILYFIAFIFYFTFGKNCAFNLADIGKAETVAAGIELGV